MFRILAFTLLLTFTSAAFAEDAKLANPVVDVGLVVTDAEKSAKFYVEALGFRELPGFEVPGDFTKEAGLTGGAALRIRVLALGEGQGTTKLKIVEAVGAKVAKAPTDGIETQAGVRYLTIHVADTTAAVERLAKAGVKPIGKTPIELPKNLPQGVFLTCVRDPDGNLVELVGPKK